MSIVTRANLSNHSEQSELLTYYNNPPFKTYDWNEIPKTSGGLPIMVYRDEKQKLKVAFQEDSHALILGATGSGKTQSVFLPLLNIKAAQKDKANMVIVDAKLELLEKAGANFKKEGYDVIVYNYRDYMHSEYYNPMSEIYDQYMDALNLEEKVKISKDQDKVLYNFLNKQYTSYKKLCKQIKKEQKRLFKEVDTRISSLVDFIIEESNSNSNSKDWDLSSKDLLKGFIYGLLEDVGDESVSRVTRENFSLKNILEIYFSFSCNENGVKDNGFFSSRDDDSDAKKSAKSLLNNASNTAKCEYSHFQRKMGMYHGAIGSTMTACNSIDLDELIANEDKPKAIFICFNDADTVAYKVIQQFVEQIYKKLIKIADALPEHQFKHAYYFIMDEFASFPAMKDFEKSISTCRSRNVWFYLCLQSYAQLESVYGAEASRTIRDNINIKYYVSSNNYQTKVEFSAECGKTTIYRTADIYSGEGTKINRIWQEEVPLVPVSQLSSIKDGELIVLMPKLAGAFLTKMERHYTCPEFKCEITRYDEYVPSADVFDDKYDYEVKSRKKSYC